MKNASFSSVYTGGVCINSRQPINGSIADQARGKVNQGFELPYMKNI